MEKLRWRDLSCAGGQWYASIVISKTSEPLLLPLSGKAMEWLPEQEDADPEDIVFSDLPDHSDVCNHLKTGYGLPESIRTSASTPVGIPMPRCF